MLGGARISITDMGGRLCGEEAVVQNEMRGGVKID